MSRSRAIPDGGAVRRRDEELAEGRHAGPSRLADEVGRDGQVAPAEHAQPLLGRDGGDRRLGLGPRRARRRGGRPDPRHTRRRRAARTSTTSRKKASGSWVMIPAPSPTSGSAPVAPRWSRLRSASRAWTTMSCPGGPPHRRDEARRRRRRARARRGRARRRRAARRRVARTRLITVLQGQGPVGPGTRSGVDGVGHGGLHRYRRPSASYDSSQDLSHIVVIRGRRVRLVRSRAAGLDRHLGGPRRRVGRPAGRDRRRAGTRGSRSTR